MKNTENGTQIKIFSVKIENPDNFNFIFGQSHFIKTVEDIYEAIVTQVPGAKFGVAFAEASGPRLVRSQGTNQPLIDLAEKNTLNIACGHTFFIFMTDFFPINIKNAVMALPEVVNIYCATANDCEVIIAQSERGKGVLGVIDGQSPVGTETVSDRRKRMDFLREIGYKLKTD